MTGITRKTFLKTGTAAALCGAGGLAPIAWGKSLATMLSEFNYGDVVLGEGALRRQFDENHDFFLKLDEDRLLKPFRQRAGLPAPGEDMGGWYSDFPGFVPGKDMRGFIPGHSFGQYVSGLARAYAVTGKPETQAKVVRLIQGFAPTISGKFYVDYHLPAYTFDKIACGLVDAYQFAGVGEALGVLDAALEAALPHLPEKALSRPEMLARPHKDEAYCWDESYTLPENLFRAFRLNGKERYKRLAVRYLQDDSYFDPLAAGKNVLPHEHAYSHVNALNSAMQAYLTLGSEKHLRAAKNGFAFVQAQSFATGGWGPNEGFVKPGSGDLGDSLTKTHAHFETPCGAYGHFKITRYLLRVTRDSRFGDSMERVLYNTILGALPLKEDGTSFYYSDYNEKAKKGYHPDKWPCCSGTFPQLAADYAISAYFRDGRGIAVNLYTPSKVAFEIGGAKGHLVQRTKYPYVPHTGMEFTLDHAARFDLSLRIPAWAGAHTAVAVNGRRLHADIAPGRFFTINREWKNGDRLDIEFVMPLRLEAVDPQHPDLVAPVWGPLALFMLEGAPTRVEKKALLAIRQSAEGSTEWTVDAAAGMARLKSFADIGTETYRLYNRTFS
jgi:uncharacterized protein